MSSTALLCYGQMAMHGGKQVLPWVDNIASRMVYYFTCSSHVSPAGLWAVGSCERVCACMYCACVCVKASKPTLPMSSPRVHRLALQVVVLMAPGKQGLVGVGSENGEQGLNVRRAGGGFRLQGFVSFPHQQLTSDPGPL